jgi:hypothetical protein
VLVAPRVPLQLAQQRYATSASGITVSQTAVQVSRGQTGRCWALLHKIELCERTLFPKSCAKWAKRAARRPEAKAEENAWLRLVRKKGRHSQRRQRKLGGQRPKERRKYAATENDGETRALSLEKCALWLGYVPLLREGLLAGEFERGSADTITGYGERMARSVVSKLVERGLLVSSSPKGPLRLGFPLAVVERWFPSLYPSNRIQNI